LDTTVNPALRASKTRNSEIITPATGDEIICIFEPMPAFPGGEEALKTFLSKNIKYPAAALKAKTGGTVFVQFVIDKTGTIRKVHTIGKHKGYGMEEEAIRVVNKMPRWIPVKTRGQYTDVQFNLPIRFVLPSQ
jgi:protein TonB